MIFSCLFFLIFISSGMDAKTWITDTMSKMTIAQKVGQLIMPSFYDWGVEQRATLKQRLFACNIGNVFHYTTSYVDMASFFTELQQDAPIPFLIASDFEMGAGWIITEGLPFQRPMARGYAGTPDSEYRIGEIIAKQGRAAGANISFSPVVDVNTHPLCPDVNTRAYSDDPNRVTELSAAFVRGMQDNSMLATLKHFPGNGHTNMDQHIGPAIIDASYEEMHTIFLKPYTEIIAAGNPGAVMVAHLEVPALCSERHPHTKRVVPASVSKEIITDLLKTQMGFKGVVITDATNMGGINNLYSREEAAVKTIQAGADIILDFYADFERDYTAILNAVESGDISMERLDDAVYRILLAKTSLNLHVDKGLPWDNSRIESVYELSQYTNFVESISEQAITLLRNNNQLVPLSDSLQDKTALVISVYSPERDVLSKQQSKLTDTVFSLELEKRGAVVTDVEVISSMTMGDVYKIVDSASAYDYVFLNFYIIPSFAIGTLMPNHNAMRLFFHGILQAHKKLVISCFGDPYVVQHFHTAPTVLCVFDESVVSQQSTVKAILGEIPITGKMPVRLQTIFERGDGITVTKKGERI